eukprot:5932718-Prymnesium_polylepis.1
MGDVKGALRVTELCYIRRKPVRTCANAVANPSRTFLLSQIRRELVRLCEPVANPSRTRRELARTRRELERTCANPQMRRESANASRTCANLREPCVNLPESVANASRTFANIRRAICVNPGGELSRICRESVNIRCESARPNGQRQNPHVST